MKGMKELWIGWLIAINLIAFALFGIDKHKAKRHAYRIPEHTLFLTAWMGGGLGAWIGMYVFHHKTKHKQFRYGIPFLFLVWLGLCLYLAIRGFGYELI